MTQIFGVDIASIVSDSMSGNLPPVTLRRTVPGTYDPVTDTETAGTDEVFSSYGIVENYSDELRAAGLVTEKDRRILVLAKNLGTTPRAGDIVEIEGQKFTVVGIPERDPASATFVMTGRL